MSQYTNVLKRLEEIFKEESIATILRTPEEEEGLPMDILTVLLDDYSEKGNEWIAEFCFLPLQNATAEVAYLSAAITIADDMTIEEADDVSWFISRFNHYAPFGAFSISEDGNTVTYKLCTPVMDNGNEEDMFEAFNLTAGHALQFVDDFGSVIEAIIEGDLTPDAALDMFVNGGNE